MLGDSRPPALYPNDVEEFPRRPCLETVNAPTVVALVSDVKECFSIFIVSVPLATYPYSGEFEPALSCPVVTRVATCVALASEANGNLYIEFAFGA